MLCTVYCYFILCTPASSQININAHKHKHTNTNTHTQKHFFIELLKKRAVKFLNTNKIFTEKMSKSFVT